MKTPTLYFSLLIILSFSFESRAQNCQASLDLPNFGCVNAQVYRGAQPTEEGIRELARRGVKMIINLRDADKSARLEEERARKAGIKFVNVPLGNWFAPKDAKIEEILALLGNAENHPIFVHCQRGADRTGTVIAAYRISHDGWMLEQVKTEAKSFDFGWWQIWMKDYIKHYYRDFHKRKNQVPPTSGEIRDSH